MPEKNANKKRTVPSVPKFSHLTRHEVIGTRPRVLGAEGFPSWHWRVGEQRLWRDWRQHRTPARGFVDSV